ncbi:hypothetical protein [Propionivibrio soli]|uniref:hypothetical protein n=1 Tax=Propionivibrio soli TaxID=2976531 RepID=UPI003B847BCF
MVEDVFISAKPVSPKKTLLLTLDLVCGLMAGILWVLIADSLLEATECAGAGRQDCEC